jgi:transcription antitermination factor NusG
MVRTNISPQPKWYVLQTKPYQEAPVLEMLRRRYYTCFLPIRRGKKAVGGMPRSTGEPLFSRYLFIQLRQVELEADRLQQIIGFSRLLKQKGRFVTVPDALISALLNMNTVSADGTEAMSERPGMPTFLDCMHELADSAARSLSLIEFICQPEPVIGTARLLPQAA